MPRVSVIIPVYNVEAYLRQCLDSVVNQTLRDIEIICVDDGSTDGSAAILAEYAAKDARVKVISRVRSNAGAARNAGMAVATGEYLGFVDSDDWCELALFEKAYAKAKADDADVVSWRYAQYDVRVQKKGAPRIFPKEMQSFPTPFGPQDLGEGIFAPITYAPWGRLVRRAFVVSEGLHFQEIVRTNDVYFCCMTHALAPRQTLVDEVLYFYRVGMMTNLQYNNAASPESVVEAWELVANELERRGMLKGFIRLLISSSANSFFYTLNMMPTTRAYADFFKCLKKLYGEHPIYSTVTEKDIISTQTATFFKLLSENDEPFKFLVKQENYYRERLSIEYWGRVSAQNSLAEARKESEKMNNALLEQKAQLTATAEKLQGQICELSAECDAAKRREVMSLKKIEQLEVDCRKRMIAYDALLAAKSKIENSASFKIGRVATWLPRKIMSFAIPSKRNRRRT